MTNAIGRNIILLPVEEVNARQREAERQVLDLLRHADGELCRQVATPVVKALQLAAQIGQNHRKTASRSLVVVVQAYIHAEREGRFLLIFTIYGARGGTHTPLFVDWIANAAVQRNILRSERSRGRAILVVAIKLAIIHISHASLPRALTAEHAREARIAQIDVRNVVHVRQVQLPLHFGTEQGWVLVGQCPFRLHHTHYRATQCGRVRRNGQFQKPVFADLLSKSSGKNQARCSQNKDNSLLHSILANGLFHRHKNNVLSVKIVCKSTLFLSKRQCFSGKSSFFCTFLFDIRKKGLHLCYKFTKNNQKFNPTWKSRKIPK